MTCKTVTIPESPDGGNGNGDNGDNEDPETQKGILQKMIETANEKPIISLGAVGTVAYAAKKSKEGK